MSGSLFRAYPRISAIILFLVFSVLAQAQTVVDLNLRR
jgi:hypothetical protein